MIDFLILDDTFSKEARIPKYLKMGYFEHIFKIQHSKFNSKTNFKTKISFKRVSKKNVVYTYYKNQNLFVTKPWIPKAYVVNLDYFRNLHIVCSKEMYIMEYLTVYLKI